MENIQELINQYLEYKNNNDNDHYPEESPIGKKLRKAYIESLPENKRLALLLHQKMCMYDHNEYCSFYYEYEKDLNYMIDSWDEIFASAHLRYLKLANELLSMSDYETIEGLLLEQESVYKFDFIKMLEEHNKSKSTNDNNKK